MNDKTQNSKEFEKLPKYIQENILQTGVKEEYDEHFSKIKENMEKVDNK